MTAAREHVRVAQRLRDMPLVRAEFARGALSYSKVRAISRVCRPTNELDLVRLARASTAAQLELACGRLRHAHDVLDEPDDVTELPELHDRLGVEVDTAAPGGRWDGRQIDWGCFWAALLPPAAPGVADRKIGCWN